MLRSEAMQTEAGKSKRFLWGSVCFYQMVSLFSAWVTSEMKLDWLSHFLSLTPPIFVHIVIFIISLFNSGEVNLFTNQFDCMLYTVIIF